MHTSRKVNYKILSQPIFSVNSRLVRWPSVRWVGSVFSGIWSHFRARTGFSVSISAIRALCTASRPLRLPWSTRSAPFQMNFWQLISTKIFLYFHKFIFFIFRAFQWISIQFDFYSEKWKVAMWRVGLDMCSGGDSRPPWTFHSTKRTKMSSIFFWSDQAISGTIVNP